MDAGVQGIAAHLDETWDSLIKAATEANDVAFQWAPGPGFNSVAILLRHLAGSERYWIGEAIGGIPSRRVRDAEFHHDRPRRDDVLRSVEEARRLTRQVLGAVSMRDLEAETTPTVTAGKPPRRPTKLWALLHYLEHLGYHRGQALLLLKMAQTAPREASAR